MSETAPEAKARAQIDGLLGKRGIARTGHTPRSVEFEGVDMHRHVLSIVIATAVLLLSSGVHATQRSQAVEDAASAAALDATLSPALARTDIPGLVVMAAT